MRVVQRWGVCVIPKEKVVLSSMMDGCPDGWSGTGIPVCLLTTAGAALQENSSVKFPRDGALMKERDYIGLGLATTTAAPEHGFHAPNSTAPLAQDKMECDNVELSLGLGLPEKAAQQAPHAEQLANTTGLLSDHVDTQAKFRLASPGGHSQRFWHHSFRVNLSSDHQQHTTPQSEASNGASLLKNYPSNASAWGIVPGLYAVPVPKVSTVPAKRPYLETVGDRRSLPIGTTHVAAIETPPLCVWNAEGASLGGGWAQQGHGSLEQGSSHLKGSSASSAFAHPRQLGAALPLPPPPRFKVPQASLGGPLPTMSNSSMGSNGAIKTSPAAEGSVKPEMEDDNSRNKAPVVGWPPVRSFRKNTLQAAQTNRTSSEDLQMKSAGGPPKGGVDGLELGANSSKNAFFVKAKLDGVRICRKVDLKAYSSYDELKSALQDMFQGFVSDNAKLDLLHGKNYVVTHEDKDGDCLLVGDVPWNMFVESSVKSLRIMKAMDAIGIGDKVSAKLKAQANGKV